MKNPDFLKRFGPRNNRDAPKHAQLRDALLAGIESGYWRVADKLPTEMELTRLTPFSLGTVQRAIRSLVQDGYIERQRGRGTFIADARRRLDEPWHFRFLDDSETDFLPVFARVLSRRRIAQRGRWSTLLGQHGDNILRVERSINVGDEFTAFNVFYLNAERFGVLDTAPIDELHGANFKLLLRRAYNLPLTHVAQNVSVRKFPPRVCKVIGMRRETASLLVEITGSAGKDNPIYFQELFIPPTTRRLYISELPLRIGK